MGLDSGCFVKSNRRKITRDMLPSEINYPFEKDYNDFVEIFYHRKDWGLRNKILNVLTIDNENEEKGYYLIDTPSKIFEIIKIITYFMNKEKWEEDGDSIWDYDEILPILQRDIINLAIIAAFMKNNPDIYLVFYDSY